MIYISSLVWLNNWDREYSIFGLNDHRSSIDILNFKWRELTKRKTKSNPISERGSIPFWNLWQSHWSKQDQRILQNFVSIGWKISVVLLLFRPKSCQSWQWSRGLWWREWYSWRNCFPEQKKKLDQEK